MSAKAAPAATNGASGPISPDDIEAKFRELQGEAEQTAETAKTGIIAAGAIAVVVIVLLAFLFGRRRGKKRTTVVEIRRV